MTHHPRGWFASFASASQRGNEFVDRARADPDGRHRKGAKRRLVEQFGVTNIAELVDLPDRAHSSVGAIVTSLCLRTTKKGDRMAWLTLADATGAIEAAVFPHAFERLATVNQIPQLARIATPSRSRSTPAALLRQRHLTTPNLTRMPTYG